MKNTRENLPTLTRGEETIMQVLWALGEGLVYDIIDYMPEPKPKYSTVATFIKMLENKGYVGHKAQGRFYRYFPTVDRNDYAEQVLQTVLKTYFGGSITELIGFYVERTESPNYELAAIERALPKIQKQLDEKAEEAANAEVAKAATEPTEAGQKA